MNTQTYSINGWLIEASKQPLTLKHGKQSWEAEGSRCTGPGMQVWLVEFEPQLWNCRTVKPPFDRREYLVCDDNGKVLAHDVGQHEALGQVH